MFWYRLFLSLWLLPGFLHAQGVTIGSNAPPDPSATLDVQSTKGGVLLPRLTTGQRDAIQNPSVGLVIFNIDKDCIEFYTSGSGWYAPCKEPPLVITDSAYNVLLTTATAAGTVVSDGGAPIIQRGICYAQHSNPTILDMVATAGGGLGSFSIGLTGLSAGTTYYRAFATNSVGTGYGAVDSFYIRSVVYFTNSGVTNWVIPPGVSSLQMTIVGGGGGGGGDVGGGGGGGQVINVPSYPVVPGQTLTITVAGQTGYPSGYNHFGQNGGSSSVSGGTGGTYTAMGGNGGRGRLGGGPGSNVGWNGGGGSYDYIPGNSGNGGFAGGNAWNNGNGDNCGGGGGSGGSGGHGTASGGGNGGSGVQSIIDGQYYGGGGGGAGYVGTYGLGTHGGGNGGCCGGSPWAADATPNTGGGGGGGHSTSSNPNAGRGASGIVIISY